MRSILVAAFYNEVSCEVRCPCDVLFPLPLGSPSGGGGCCALVLRDSLAELEHMWIRPEHMGNGVGRALFQQIVVRAAQLKVTGLELSADPNAEGFYQRMGAARIGEVRYEIEGEARVLPR